jgi:hypothetical protein
MDGVIWPACRAVVTAASSISIRDNRPLELTEHAPSAHATGWAAVLEATKCSANTGVNAR